MENSSASSESNPAFVVSETASRLLRAMIEPNDKGKVLVPRWLGKYRQWCCGGEILNRECEWLIRQRYACIFPIRTEDFGLRATREGEVFLGLG